MFRVVYFLLFVVFTSCTSTKYEKIVLQPFNGFSSEIVDSLVVSNANIFQISVTVQPSIKIPKQFFVHQKTPRYRADSIIKYFKNTNPSNQLIQGLMIKDISTSKRGRDGEILEPKSKYTDWGVFGLGYRPGNTSVISVFRIKSGNKKQYLERIRKISAHEIGHNLGLPHCKNSETCVMRDAAEKLSTVDNVDLKLCEDCSNKIR